MKVTARPQRCHDPGLRPVIERFLIATGITCFVLAYGVACYNLSTVMKDVSSSLAILAAIGG